MHATPWQEFHSYCLNAGCLFTKYRSPATAVPDPFLSETFPGVSGIKLGISKLVVRHANYYTLEAINMPLTYHSEVMIFSKNTGPVFLCIHNTPYHSTLKNNWTKTNSQWLHNTYNNRSAHKFHLFWTCVYESSIYVSKISRCSL